MTRMTTLALAWALAGTGFALAAPTNGITLSPDKRIVYAPPSNAAPASYKAVRTGQTTIFDNLATLDKKGVFMVGTGFAFGGPNSLVGLTQLAAAFTPAQAATVTEVEVAAGYIEGKKHTAIVTIYADNAGAPGSTLWQGQARMPIDGNCCKTVTLTVTGGPQLAAGTQYWLGLSATPKGSDTFAAWLFNVADQIDPGLTAANLGAGWLVNPSLPNVAFAIYGN
jgi:hypothetical protein